MSKRCEQRAARVQVYFENPKVEVALRREARAARIPLSRAAERAIERGMARAEAADPSGQLSYLEGVLRDHARRTANDMSMIQGLLLELARAVFLRLPDSNADRDPRVQVSVERRIDGLAEAAAERIVGGSIPLGASGPIAHHPSSSAPFSPEGGLRAAG